MLNAYLIYISSTINPFIYWFMNKDFRRAFKEVLPFFGNSFGESENSNINRAERTSAPTELTARS
jgi:O-antigen/teichoic acid export membrane protein